MIIWMMVHYSYSHCIAQEMGSKICNHVKIVMLARKNIIKSLNMKITFNAIDSLGYYYKSIEYLYSTNQYIDFPSENNAYHDHMNDGHYAIYISLAKNIIAFLTNLITFSCFVENFYRISLFFNNCSKSSAFIPFFFYFLKYSHFFHIFSNFV